MQNRDLSTILIVGEKSMIGVALAASYAQDGVRILKTSRQSTDESEGRLYLDLENDIGDFLFPSEPISIAFICAGMTSNEQCRLHPILSRKVNVDNTIALVKRLIGAGIFVVFLSTNLVFDGETPFAKTSGHLFPKTEYGCQKTEVEEQLLSLGDKVAIVRFSKIIGPEMSLIEGWHRDLKAGKYIYPFSDMVMAPVSLDFAIEVLKRVSDIQLSGITQVSATKDITFENAAHYIAKQLGFSLELIRAISCKESGVLFSPKHTTLDSTRLVSLGLESPPPTNALNIF